MACSDAPGELGELARARHVHFDVLPSEVIEGIRRFRDGFEIRVWGVHEKGARALPGCARCRDLIADLDRIARWALPNGARPPRAVVERPGLVLYDSREVPGADEVAVTIRLTHLDGGPTAAPSDELILREVRARLRTLGVPER